MDKTMIINKKAKIPYTPNLDNLFDCILDTIQKNKDRATELEIEHGLEQGAKREAAWIEYNEDTKEQFEELTNGDFKEIDNGI